MISASLEMGLLHIELERPLVQPQVRKIKIDNKEPESGETSSIQDIRKESTA